MSQILAGKRILLIVSGGIAAYKTPELVRRLREEGLSVRCVVTEGGAKFVTPLTLGALSEDKVYHELFSLTDENEMGHINLSRQADAVVIAPASANILSKMAHGQADDLASTVLLASSKPIFAAPAMNVRMWENPATRANLDTLACRGITILGPTRGDMACGEFGMGRMLEPEKIVVALTDFFYKSTRLAGRHAIVTSGPTHEAIDPVRYITNRSSGKQGHAIANALSQLGTKTTLVTGPTSLLNPPGVKVIAVETASQMLAACEAALPADIAICAAAVTDWRVKEKMAQKLKKKKGETPNLLMVENPDILHTLSNSKHNRPRLVVGFAAETENVIDNATAKLTGKGCDWIIANDVSPINDVFANDTNTIHLITADGVEDWPKLSKADVGTRIAERIAQKFEAFDG